MAGSDPTDVDVPADGRAATPAPAPAPAPVADPARSPHPTLGSESEPTTEAAVARVARRLADRFGTDPALVAWALRDHPAVVRAVGVEAAAAAVVVCCTRDTDAPRPHVVAAAVDARSDLVAAAVARLAGTDPAFRTGRR